mgnify:CR=1 FL=1
MSKAVQEISKMKAGTCPHGLPAGTCPICSGGGSMRKSDRNRKIGEMTYHECVMMGNILKARALAKKNHQIAQKSYLESIKNFENQLINLIQKMQNFQKQISSSILLKPIAFCVKNLAIPLVKVLKSTVNIVINTINKIVEIKQKIVDITEKLTAVLGEAKAFINKKIADIMSNLKNKFKNLFKIGKKNNTDEEETEIDEDKKIFNLKSVIKNFQIKILKKDKNNGNSSKNQQ